MLRRFPLHFAGKNIFLAIFERVSLGTKLKKQHFTVKENRPSKMSDSGASNEGLDFSTLVTHSRKRKRDSDGAELEVNINAPEPPSKKALRKAKKAKTVPPTSAKDDIATAKSYKVIREPAAADGRKTPAIAAGSERVVKRSEHGIWIGNLPWSAMKLDVRTFITSNTDIQDDEITRMHMPSPRERAVGDNHGSTRVDAPKFQNKGFAYIDFSHAAALSKALALSETLLCGRRVLIKDSKSFEGRPAISAGDDSTRDSSGKPPSKRIFIGNLGFDSTDEDLRKHFARCGQVNNVHLATFEDSGKCKGYAWVEFEELSAAESAMRGWVDFYEDDDDDQAAAENEDYEIRKALHGTEDDNDSNIKDVGEEEKKHHQALKPLAKTKTSKSKKPRKWWVNKLKGRSLRMEFAEGKEVRYKKRYGTGRKPGDSSTSIDTTATTAAADSIVETVILTTNTSSNTHHAKTSAHVHQRSRPKHTIGGQIPQPRLTGGILESKGKKIILS